MKMPSLVSFSEVDGMAVFTFLSSIGLSESEVLKKDLRGHLKTKPFGEAVFLMERVHYLDSSGLGLFVALQHEFRETTRFRISGLRPNVRLVFVFSNLLNYFKIDDSGAEVLKVPEPPRPELATPPEPSTQKEFLSIEGKYILTEEGINYCIQKQIPIQDIRLYRGATASGFAWSRVNTALLERFVTHGLLEGMELERTEFIDKRSQILRLTEVMFDGIVMKRFRPLLKLKLMEDETYRRLISHGVSPIRLRGALKEHSRTIGLLKTEIEEMILARSSGASRPKTARLLELIDESVWFLLVQPQSTAGNRALRQTVLDALIAYSGRLELSESIALNLMEFLQQAEKAHFLNLAERDALTRKNPQSIPEMLAHSSFRDRLVAKAKLQNEYLVMNISFDGNPHDSLNRLVAEVTVRNKGIAGNSSRAESLSKKSNARTSRSLEQGFLDGDSSLGLDDMSLMNLNALKNLCRDQGIQIDTALTRDERSNETIASIKLVL